MILKKYPQNTRRVNIGRVIAKKKLAEIFLSTKKNEKCTEMLQIWYVARQPHSKHKVSQTFSSKMTVGDFRIFLIFQTPLTPLLRVFFNFLGHPTIKNFCQILTQHPKSWLTLLKSVKNTLGIFGLGRFGDFWDPLKPPYDPWTPPPIITPSYPDKILSWLAVWHLVSDMTHFPELESTPTPGVS